MATSTLPVPDAAQVRQVRAAMKKHLSEFNFADAHACQSWLSTYVTHRADGKRVSA